MSRKLSTYGKVLTISGFALGVAEIGIGLYNMTQGEFQEGIQDVCIGAIALKTAHTFANTPSN